MEKGIDADFSRIVDNTDPTVHTRVSVRARSQSSRRAVVGTASPSPFENAKNAPVASEEHSPLVYPRQSSTLTRGVHAFTTLFIQRLDDHRLLSQFPPRNGYPIETAPLQPIRNIDNSSVSRPLLHGVSLPRTGNHDNHSSKSDGHAGVSFSARSSNLWQRVCQVSNNLYATYISSPPCSYSVPSHSSCDSTAPVLDQQVKSSQPRIHSPSAHHSDPSDVKPAIAVKGLPHGGQKVISGDSQDAGAGRNPEQVRGSYMAIVVGLVAGVVWF